MTKLLRIAGELYNTPLLITPQYAGVISTVLADRTGVQPSASADEVQAFVKTSAAEPTINGNIAIMPLVGSMVHRGDAVDASSGLQSYTHIQDTLMNMAETRGVEGILADMDTPGGAVNGISSVSETIRYIQEVMGIPVWAYANASMCSGGMWIASACDRVYSSPEGAIGSVGVCTMHIDQSQQLEKAGLVVTHIYSGKHKVDGNAQSPLPDAVRDQWQVEIDALYENFVSVVSDGRGIDAEAVKGTEARIFSAHEAADLGLVDGVMSMTEVVNSFRSYLQAPTIGTTSTTQHGVTLMSDKDKKPAVYSQEQFDAAVAEAAAKASGEASVATADAVAEAAAKGAKAERERRTAIMNSEEGKKRPVAANSLCENTDMNAETAIAALAGMAVESKAEPQASGGKTFQKVVAEGAPNISPEGDDVDEDDVKASRLASLRKAGAHANAAVNGRKH